MTTTQGHPDHRRHRSAGFTFVELSPVHGLTAIVVSRAVTRDRLDRDRLDRHRAVADVTRIAISLHRCADDNRGDPSGLGDVGLVSMRDRWDEPYQDLPTAGGRVAPVRKDRTLHLLNADFDLHSNGPHRDTAPPLTARARRDDIVCANHGGFVGVARND